MLSLIWVVSYLALGLPAVVAGVLVVHGGGIPGTAREYGSAVMLLAACGREPEHLSLDKLPASTRAPAPSSLLQVLEHCG